MNYKGLLDCFNQCSSHTLQLVNLRMLSLSRGKVKKSRTLYSMNPKTHIHIHVDGRGFAAQRKDATPGGVEVERGIFSGERDISSSQFAIVSTSTQSISSID